jgi:hypothetical protein
MPKDFFLLPCRQKHGVHILCDVDGLLTLACVHASHSSVFHFKTVKNKELDTLFPPFSLLFLFMID